LKYHNTFSSWAQYKNKNSLNSYKPSNTLTKEIDKKDKEPILPKKHFVLEENITEPYCTPRTSSRKSINSNTSQPN
jgi:hypothetical protein